MITGGNIDANQRYIHSYDTFPLTVRSSRERQLSQCRLLQTLLYFQNVDVFIIHFIVIR